MLFIESQWLINTFHMQICFLYLFLISTAELELLNLLMSNNAIIVNAVA